MNVDLPGCVTRHRDVLEMPAVMNPDSTSRTNLAVSMEKPRVFLVMPHNFVVHPRASRSFYASNNPRNVEVIRRDETIGSILPHTFNEGLANALKLRDKGEITHFAMLHSDIEAETWWIDCLYSELWKWNATVVSAIVPIKEHSRLRTSTAIGIKGDPWKFRRSVKISDIKELPKTFGPEHVCYDDEVLMINTGCWIADLRHPFWDDCDGLGTPFCFEQLTRMVRHDDSWVAEQVSEDWLWSHRMAERGVRYMVTRKVRVRHHGPDFWDNNEFDEGDRVFADPVLS